MNWRTRSRTLTFPRRPLVMAIVNINDDSFCGDGTLVAQQALAQIEQQLRSGADIIDLGAESARTNRGPISEAEEIDRLLPVLFALPELIARIGRAPWDDQQIWPPLLSVNTWRSAVIASILTHPVDLINDISALPDAQNAALCRQHGSSLLIMHSQGAPKVPHTHIGYADIMQTLHQFFSEKIALAKEAGLEADQIILDPGIDFAKQRPHNLTIYRELQALASFDRPILLPVSRKTVIGEVLCQPSPLERDPGTLACIATGIRRGAHILRVHNVRAAALAVKTLHAVESAETVAIS